MKLREYLLIHGLSFEGFGRQVGETARTVRRWCLDADHPDARIPRRDRMALVVVTTGGAVRPDDFYGFDFSLLDPGAERRSQAAYPLEVQLCGL